MAVVLEHDEPTNEFVGRDRDWLSQAKCDAERSECVELIVDLTDVGSVNSNDLSELIRLQLHVKHDGRRLVLSNVQESVFQVFTLTRLDRLIELRHDGHFDPPSAHFMRG